MVTLDFLTVNYDLVIWCGLASAFVIIVFFLVKRKRKADEPSTFEKEPTLSNSEIISFEAEKIENNEATSFFAALSKSRNQFSKNFQKLFVDGLDEKVRENLESILLSSDFGLETTEWVLNNLVARSKEKKVYDSASLIKLLKQILGEILDVTQKQVDSFTQKPFVILMIGVNGVGKTTTIGKLAYQLKQKEQKVLLAAGDTFRVAAVEQLKKWGERSEVPVIAQDTGADSASVLFDACQSARARGFDVVLADTAGRLQNKSNLMSELSKIGRVLGKLDIGAPHEVFLVLDAATGQNAVSQMREFTEAIQPTGIVLTKLDGSAKGGIVFALAREFGVPIRYVGLGEKIEDLQLFDKTRFVNALFAEFDA